MVSLLDVNVLVAITDPDHQFHESIHRWLGQHPNEQFATCPSSLAGLVRVIANPSYPSPITPAKAVEVAREITRHPAHVFWADDVRITDETVIDERGIRGHNQISDVMLLALAVSRGGRLVTFDKGIQLAVVRTARPENLEIIGGRQ